MHSFTALPPPPPADNVLGILDIPQSCVPGTCTLTSAHTTVGGWMGGWLFIDWL